MSKAWLVAIVAALGLIAIAGCGGDPESSSGGDQAGGTQPAATTAAASEAAPTGTVETASAATTESANEEAGSAPALRVNEVEADYWEVDHAVFELDHPQSGPIEVPTGAEFLPLGIIDPSEVTNPWRVCYFQDGLNNVWLEQTKNASAQAGEYFGVEVAYQDAGWDAARQLNQIENAISQDQCDGIVAMTIDPAVVCKALSQDAPDAGVPVVIINISICDDDTYTDGTVAFESFQNIDSYRAMVDHAFAEFAARGGGKAAVVEGPAGWKGTTLIEKVYEEMKEKYPTIDIVQRLNGDFTVDSGLNLGQTILTTHPDIGLIYSSYDQMTVGIVKALEAAGKEPGDVVVGSQAADHNGFELVRDGWVINTALAQPLEEAAHGIELLVAHLEGVDVPQYVNEGAVLLTKDNLDQIRVEN